MMKLRLLLAGCAVAMAQPAASETVYEFVSQCRQEQLGDCFYQIDARLERLNAGTDRRVCLPQAFGATMTYNGAVPVSLLEHVRLGLSAARFGNAEQDVDDAITAIVNRIYRCD